MKLHERRNEALKWELLRQGGCQEKFDNIAEEVCMRLCCENVCSTVVPTATHAVISAVSCIKRVVVPLYAVRLRAAPGFLGFRPFPYHPEV